jgi:hypothetical protein
MQPCPSDFTLDDLEIHGGVAPPEIAAHVSSCPRCAARRTARLARKEEFRAEMAPAVWRAIERERPRDRWRKWWFYPALAATIGVAVVLARPRWDRGQYVGTKGGPSVEIVCRRGAQVLRIGPGEALAPGDELRFRPQGAPADARYLVVGSVDGSGRYTSFYPAAFDGVSVPLPPAGEILPGGIRIDAAPGPERLLTLWSAQPITAAAVAPVAEAAAADLGRITEIAHVPVTSQWQVMPKGNK